MSGRIIELPEVLAGFPTTGPVCIEASAGTGKTYTLEHLLLKLIVEDGVPIESVLVVTFTEKATLELIARLRERLLEARLRIAGGPDQGPEARQALRRIEAALRNYDRACIKTIHGFCQETLADGAMPAGMLLEQQLIAQHTVAREVLLEVVRERIAEDSTDGLALRAFLTRHGFDHLLTLHAAVAGERGTLVPPWNLEAFRAALPSDYPSAEEITAWVADKGLSGIREPAKTLLPAGLIELPGVVQSITSDAVALSPENGWLAWGGTPVGASTRFQVTANWLSKDKVQAKPLGERLAAIYLALLEHAPQPAAYLTDRIFPEVRALAGARKRALGLLDYDDMLLRLDAALEGESGDRLRDEVRERFSWVLIDEFQDTDALQWKIFSSLFGGTSQSDPHRIVVVGDPKQAIYGFRGGDLPVYLEARDRIVGSGNPVLQLETSYRSTPRLLQALGALFEQDYFDDDELEAPPLAHGPEHDALTDAAGNDLAPVALLAAPNDVAGWPHTKVPTGRALRRGLVAEILRLTGDDAPVHYRRKDGEPRRLRHGDCMVLCLTGRECESIGRALGEAGIPHAFFKQEGLMESAEADHLRLLLEALADPGDRSARARLWLTPFFELPLAGVEAARELPETDPLHALPQAWAELAAARRFEALFDAVLVESGLRRRLAEAADERALTNYLHLCEHLLAAARREPLRIDDLSRQLRLDDAGGRQPEDTDVRRLETERDAVQILTLHKAKGLEAPVVLLGSALLAKGAGGMNHHFDTSCDVFHDGRERMARLPSRFLEGPTLEAHDAAIAREVLREKQRLFYVAATRARARLVVPAALPLDCGHPGAAALVEDPPAKPKALSFARGYDTFNARLCALVDTPELAPLFEILPLRDHLDDAPRAAATARPHLPPLPGAAPDLDGEVLRAARRAPVLTSYSRMKRGTDGLAPTELTARPPLDDLAERLPASLEHDPVLPGGVRTGLFLHSLLEEAPFDRVRDARTPADFVEDAELLRRARRLAERHGLPPAAAERGLALTFTSLRRELALGAVALPGGLCQVGQHRPELSFVYPIPELAHPLLEAAGGQSAGSDPLPFRVGRGFVTGVIDLVFEHEGKVFFLDWKSDRVPDYAPAALAEHVAAHYALQARLYTLAVTRLFGIRDASDYEQRFGGLAYLYLRGEAPGGLHFERPAWSELVDWESGLLTHAERAIARSERSAHEEARP